MTLVLKLDLDIIKMYVCTKNQVPTFSGSKAIIWMIRNVGTTKMPQTSGEEGHLPNENAGFPDTPKNTCWRKRPFSQWECRISRHNKNQMLPKRDTMLTKHFLVIFLYYQCACQYREILFYIQRVTLIQEASTFKYVKRCWMWTIWIYMLQVE